MIRLLNTHSLVIGSLILLSSCLTSHIPTDSSVELTAQDQFAEFQLNQVAFDKNSPKSALLLLEENIDIQSFTIELVDRTTENTININLTLTPLNQAKNWQVGNTEEYLYKINFDYFTQPGNYNLRLLYQDKTVLSPSFSIGENQLFLKTTPAILSYFNASRNDHDDNWQQDHSIRIFDTERFVDVHGGWNDAGGDSGKYLSHLSYSNFHNPQQLALVGWALAYSFQSVPELYKQLNLNDKIISEVFWGADYLHRILDPQGYFYMTVFDRWGTENAERVVTSYEGPDGVFTNKYQSAFRQGAGVAIAALARAAMLADQTSQHGDYTAAEYLADAERAFEHLLTNNERYCDDNKENIIDDYSALFAAVELYRATEKVSYLKAARVRANNLTQRLSVDGWFISNDITSDNLRPFYHAAEAGFPVFSLAQYVSVETNAQLQNQAQTTIDKALIYQLELNKQVNNPYNYARQPFKTYKDDKLDRKFQTGFFIPHDNETGYWWQGESARLSSLTAATIIANKQTLSPLQQQELMIFSQNQMDWTLGRNPYGLTMLNGFGQKNPQPYQGLTMLFGGISNGITGSKHSSTGAGIEYGPEVTWHNWRWVEQWLPHAAWFLIATTEMAKENQQ